MTNIKKYLVPFLIILVTLILAKIIFDNPPKSDRGRGPKGAQMSVEVMQVKPQAYQVEVESFGNVQPRTQSALVAQVSGQIVKTSEQFREGGFFNKGDVLIELDDRDYIAEQKIAQASLLSAQQLLLEEQARVEQALADWQRLGNGNKASALVLREPQLAAAKAQVLSAQAQLEKADLALERSKIIAPYNGRMLNQHVDLGQVVSANTVLADIYAIDNVEIRLPIKNKDLALIQLPEEFINKQNMQQGPTISLYSQLTGQQSWQGQVVRTEGAIDTNSQQLHIVGQIDDPFSKTAQHSTAVKIGQYMTAKIQGKLLHDSLIIPNSAIYQGSYVYLVKDNLLMRQDIKIRWQNKQDALITDGLSAGDQLVITPLGQISSGTPVDVVGAPANKKKGRGDKRPGQAKPAQGAKP
ncbi:efflux RND transporter periplasmic adaptor subunit [Thalassotalea sp. PLHSN55]|uniref:efflux RND transporter periplasmic adaptor subunit n=1 Tax=Thalassotalea sp. PLHSN55 TaxID=3435888 RepID=UPI003F877C8A